VCYCSEAAATADSYSDGGREQATTRGKRCTTSSTFHSKDGNDMQSLSVELDAGVTVTNNGLNQG
jgi:hypothetical protein